ncbi:MAG: Mut7-C ubiquitin/RNAse domain-containing protein [Armatimonadetes bacterium]|nr:Mut7-C ubiquitin/RNAse domain-containing protein [Armatimonadota bacterium]
MNRATFRFYAELNDFLPPERRGKSFVLPFTGHPSVKDRIEAAGVPHPEVDLLLVNGVSADFSTLLHDGDRVSAYPRFRRIDVAAITRVRPPPLEEPRFVLDIHLGQLAEYLRLLGFDARYRNDFHDETLARISHDEARILLTKDRGLLKRGPVVHAYYVRNSDPKRQVVEVLRRFALFDSLAPFRRCLHCNGALERVEKEAVLDRLEPKTRLYYDAFSRCPECDRLYWKGSHHERMQRFVEWVLAQGERETDF